MFNELVHVYNKTSPGPDNEHIIFLTKYISVLAVPLL